MKTGFLYLWLPFVGGYGLIWAAMAVANRHREKPLEDPELQKREGGVKMFLIGFLPTLLLLGTSIFIPLAGASFLLEGLFVTGAGMLVYFLALGAHGKGGPLTTGGIYRWSRNPMYVGGALFFSGLALAGWQSLPVNYIFVGYILLWAGATHYMVLREESFLSDMYKEEYRHYCSESSRYFGIPGSRGKSN